MPPATPVVTRLPTPSPTAAQPAPDGDEIGAHRAADAKLFVWQLKLQRVAVQAEVLEAVLGVAQCWSSFGGGLVAVHVVTPCSSTHQPNSSA